MMRFNFGWAAALLVATCAMRGAADDTAPRRAETMTRDGQVAARSGAIDLAAFAPEVEAVEQELAAASGFSREELLVMFGRSSAAAGRFDVAAAAYAMFLNEFDTDHPYSGKMAAHLADCLFPFRYDQVDVIHSGSGPKLEPAWRMGYTPRPEHLRQAVHAFELAASLDQDGYAKGSALLKLGWVHRVLGDWDASTAAWDRCAKEAAPTRSAADALWLAAENLEWTNCPTEAAEHLEHLASNYPADARISAAMERIEYLQADARRGADWLSDPAASLQSEIEGRAGSRSPQEVNRSVAQWLQRRGEREASIAVSRWASMQNGWAIMDRVHARFNLADALLNENPPREATRVEAVEVLQSVAAMDIDDAWTVPAAVRAYRLLVELNRPQEAERFLGDFGKTRIQSQPWGPVLLTAEIESLLQRGETARARDKLTRLRTLHPDYDLMGRFAGLLGDAEQEGGESR
jgi:tetratricopeptide (TPR) repeat protein